MISRDMNIKTDYKFASLDDIKSDLISSIDYSKSTKKKMASFLIETENNKDIFIDTSEIVRKINFYIDFIDNCIDILQKIVNEFRYQVLLEHADALEAIYSLGKQYYDGLYKSKYGFQECFRWLKSESDQGIRIVSTLDALSARFVYDTMIEIGRLPDRLKILAQQKSLQNLNEQKLRKENHLDNDHDNIKNNENIIESIDKLIKKIRPEIDIFYELLKEYAKAKGWNALSLQYEHALEVFKNNEDKLNLITLEDIHKNMFGSEKPYREIKGGIIRCIVLKKYPEAKAHTSEIQLSVQALYNRSNKLKNPNFLSLF